MEVGSGIIIAKLSSYGRWVQSWWVGGMGAGGGGCCVGAGGRRVGSGAREGWEVGLRGGL